jgi:hypothetical protein
LVIILLHLITYILLLLGHHQLVARLLETNNYGGLRDAMWITFIILSAVAISAQPLLTQKTLTKWQTVAFTVLSMASLIVVYSLLVCLLTNILTRSAGEGFFPHPGNSGMQLYTVDKDLFVSVTFGMFPYWVFATVLHAVGSLNQQRRHNNAIDSNS